MMRDPMKALPMQKIILFLALAGFAVFAGAQTPVKPVTTKPAASKTAALKPAAAKSKPATTQSQPTVSAQAITRSQARAAAEATAQLQAQAIAQAAASAQTQASLPSPASIQPAATAALRVGSPAIPVLAALPALAAAPDKNVKTTAPMATSLASEHMAIADRVHQGLMPCELGASVRIEADAAKPGYFHLQGKGFRYHMRPVTTTTGAIRLEDDKAGAVWLQLANKSMLMDQNKGRRVADECAHPTQTAYAHGMKTSPPPSLFDTTGMGRPKD
jgi:hypothetical protein